MDPDSKDDFPVSTRNTKITFIEKPYLKIFNFQKQNMNI